MIKQHYLIIAVNVLKKYNLDLAFLDNNILEKIHKLHAEHTDNNISLKQKISDIIAEYIGKQFTNECPLKIIREKPIKQREFQIIGKLTVYTKHNINAVNLDEAITKAENFSVGNFIEIDGIDDIINTIFEIHDIIDE